MIPMFPTPQFSMNDPWLPLRLWILGLMVLGLAGLDLLEAEPPLLSRPEFALPQPGRISNSRPTMEVIPNTRSSGGTSPAT